jgi:hypothetical protein
MPTTSPLTRWHPKGARAFHDRMSSAVAYVYESNGKIFAIGYHGRAQKPDWHYRYRDKAECEAAVRRHFEKWQRIEAAAIARREERKAFAHSFKPGDIFKTHWGYDQINVEWYECIAVKGKHLIVTEIERGSVETAWCEGQAVPLPGKPIGEPFRVLAQRDGFRIKSFIWASFQPPVMVAGVPTYKPARWSSYA